MLLTIDETVKLIEEGKLLHLAGSENLLRQLPRGNWIGGSTEYFMTRKGGKTSGNRVYANIFPYDTFKISVYDADTISNVAKDAYDDGFTILILPGGTPVHFAYAEKSAEYEDMFMKNIVGWLTGGKLSVPYTPVATNGLLAETYTDKAVALHLAVPEGKTASVGIVNVFSQDDDSPVIEFDETGFSAGKARVDGKEVVFADYLAENHIDRSLPLVGNYSGAGVNISFNNNDIVPDRVLFYAPVFPGIQYKMSKKVGNYIEEFAAHINKLGVDTPVFCCNCIVNFFYGELEGKGAGSFCGPISFGEIAYQILNQTLVYVTVT